MKSTLKIALIAISIITFQNCNNKEVVTREFPRLNTLEVTNISGNGALFNAEILYRSDFEILSYGFTWSVSEGPNLLRSDRVIFSDNLSANHFSAEISTTLKEDLVYHVKPFIQTSDYTVYGQEVTFTSLGSNAPQILSFTPLTATWGDTLLITGKNFSYRTGMNEVYLGDIKANVFQTSDTLLAVKIPSVLNTSEVSIRVSVYGNSSISENLFSYLIPRIDEITPLRGTFKDTITINGANFSRFFEQNVVLIAGRETEIVSLKTNQIRVLIPGELTSAENSIQVFSVGYTLNYDLSFKLNAPVVSYFEPDTARKPNETITLFGENFSSILKNNMVSIEGFQAAILDVNDTSIKVILPNQAIPYYTISTYKNIPIKVTVAEQISEAPENLAIHWESTWTKKNDFPGAGRYKAVAFEADGKGYFGTGISVNDLNVIKDFWEYDALNDQWTQIKDLPGDARGGAVAFSIDNKGYVGLGSANVYWYNREDNRNHFKDFYRYDPELADWEAIADFGGVGRHSSAVFVINEEAYVGTGNMGLDSPTGIPGADDFWKYNPSTNSWTVEAAKFPEKTSMAAGCSIGEKGYIYAYNTLYEFDNGSWNQLDGLYIRSWDIVAFSINNLSYFGLGVPHSSSGAKDLFEYDPLTQAITNHPLSNYRYGASVFVIDNKAYIIGGATYKDEIIYLKDVWEFDPSKPE